MVRNSLLHFIKSTLSVPIILRSSKILCTNIITEQRNTKALFISCLNIDETQRDQFKPVTMFV